MPLLGAVGTLVWDTIHAPGAGQDRPILDWGGIAYSLAAFEAAAPGGWSLLPIIKVGADLRAEADAFLDGLASIGSLEGVVTVPAGNNRVELFYQDRSRRCERLTGGVPGWRWEELESLVLSCDALYVNFVAGWELDLPGARRLGQAFGGRMYCDVHSLLLDVGADGVRSLRPLRDRDAWLSSFDILQVNEQELFALVPHGTDHMEMADDLLACGLEAVLITLGAEGSAWVTTEGSPMLQGGDSRGRATVGERSDTVDPTGCGDVWGMACFGNLLAGAPLADAVRRANDLAARNATASGTRGLAKMLRTAGTGATP
jgi:hypothetical protein